MNTHNPSLIHQFETPQPGLKIPLFILILIGVTLLGTGIGFGFSRIAPGSSSSSPSPYKVQTDKSAGIEDKKTFKDSAEGLLREGGIDGEGNFHLERPGGISQNVYLTSSTVDLSKYIGKKVKVQGETFNSNKAGWLMDVGLVEIK